jgi:tetratricopeptide (TPR) repeat protein
MSNDLEQWQWVDEDPFEKLLRTPKKDENDLRAQAPANSAPDQSPVHFDPPVYSENPKPVAESPVETVAAGVSAPATAHIDLAESLERLEQWEAAANAFRRALELQPEHEKALIGLGACLLHLDCAEEALNCFGQCRFSDTERHRALLGRAVALQKLACNEDADRAYRELLQITPDAPEPLANLIALSVTRQDAAALAEFSRRLLRVDPRNKAALKGLATLAIWDEDQIAAVDYCRRLLEVDPTSFEGRHNLEFANQRMRPAEKAMRSIA